MGDILIPDRNRPAALATVGGSHHPELVPDWNVN